MRLCHQHLTSRRMCRKSHHGRCSRFEPVVTDESELGRVEVIEEANVAPIPAPEQPPIATAGADNRFGRMLTPSHDFQIGGYVQTVLSRRSRSPGSGGTGKDDTIFDGRVSADINFSWSYEDWLTSYVELNFSDDPSTTKLEEAYVLYQPVIQWQFKMGRFIRWFGWNASTSYGG